MKEKETLNEKLGRVISMAGSAILMNLLFLVSCLPIVTIGQAWCGLLSAIRYNIRGESWFLGFKKGYKTRFWRGSIVWCVMLSIDAYLLLDLHHAVAQEYLVPLIAACVMFALAAMVTTSFLVLNVYIPTKVGEWIRNAVDMVFKAPIALLGAAVLLWLPVILVLLFFNIFYYTALIFLALYFTLATLGVTMVLKNALVQYLIEARASGTLLAEEGDVKKKEEEE